ncbi:MAG: hypothetical protein KJN99_02525 [Marinicaulis sp.]|nr:hypothetical protein [Marinicaulis sp.]
MIGVICPPALSNKEARTVLETIRLNVLWRIAAFIDSIPHKDERHGSLKGERRGRS